MGSQRGTISDVMWLWVILVVVVVGAVGVVVVDRWGTMSDVYPDRPDRTIPVDRPLTAADIRDVRLSTGARGYRMDEVDALLDRVEADLRAREGQHDEAGDDSDEGSAGTEPEPDDERSTDP